MAIISFCSVSKFRRLAAAEHPTGRITKLRSDGSESCRHFILDFEQRQTDKQTQTQTEADYVETIKVDLVDLQ